MSSFINSLQRLMQSKQRVLPVVLFSGIMLTTLCSAVTTKSIFSRIPKSFQNAIRDAGFFHLLGDIAAAAIGTQQVLMQPNLILRFLRNWRSIRTYQYGENSRHFIEFITFDRVPAGAARNTSAGDTVSNDPSVVNVLLFAHGGAWGSGKTWQYRLNAEGIARVLGVDALAVLGYPLYPEASILHQSDSVQQAIGFIRSHSDILLNQHHMTTAGTSDGSNINNSTPEKKLRIILAGHSSGANICALASLAAAIERDAAHIADVYIGLSGVFDIQKHYHFEANRGVHEVSPMAAAALGYENFAQSSPTILLQHIDDQVSTNNPNTKTSPNANNSASGNISAMFPHTILIHGVHDDVVPHTSSVEFATELLKKNVQVQQFYLDNTHIEPILDFMQLTPTPCTNALLSGWNKYLKSTSTC